MHSFGVPAGNQSDRMWNEFSIIRNPEHEFVTHATNAEFERAQSDYFAGAGPKPYGWQDSEFLCCFPVKSKEIKRMAINARLVNSVYSRQGGRAA